MTTRLSFVNDNLYILGFSEIDTDRHDYKNGSNQQSFRIHINLFQSFRLHEKLNSEKNIKGSEDISDGFQ